MQLLTIELTGNDSLEALQELENKHLIRIIKEPDYISYTMSGETLEKSDFQKWISYAENSESVSLAEAKQRWGIQKKNLR